ncbi:MAG: 6-pyruvoyl tetrahydropterin synthase family protein [Planctomycetaceae bacterium]|nr:6-pyruvoyl tetrahydropterin synthase family protein [Planctomycetaceae bacterium]
MSKPFAARVTKDSLVFSAGHFITFNGNVCERLHGHNWRVDVTITGELDENGYVFDFIALRDASMKLVQHLDHCVLLPDSHPLINVCTSDDGREVTATFEERRWVFPSEDCRILPVPNTTAELIADWFGKELIEALDLQTAAGAQTLKVGIEENFGQWAYVTLDVS